MPQLRFRKHRKWRRTRRGRLGLFRLCAAVSHRDFADGGAINILRAAKTERGYPRFVLLVRLPRYAGDMRDLAKADFSAGCFWGVEAAFREVAGVSDAVSGYEGGHTEHPTYEQVCTDETGHAETVEVTYDPGKVSYETLVRKFFAMHDPTQVNRQGVAKTFRNTKSSPGDSQSESPRDTGTQYRSVIFYRTSEQKEIGERVIAELQSRYHPKTIATSIEPAQVFWKAEEYHQRYFEKRPNAACHI